MDGAVADERLLLPFPNGSGVSDIIASLKTISEDGGFEIKNLMRGSETLQAPRLRTIIDRDLFHRAPGRIPDTDVIDSASRLRNSKRQKLDQLQRDFRVTSFA
ncbi:MAG: hypothetical protein QOD89_286 [Bradyrhizobium sp.]|jgi:hypothetical protein|nr:hypothetical protein [Bradyrhizobium sp.]